MASVNAYCTLLLTDGYLPGAMVLGHSLRDAGARQLLVAFVTLDTVAAASIAALQTVYDQVIPLAPIYNPSPSNLYLMNRPDLASTFTKIALWRQTQFQHLLYIDADIVALRAPEELFHHPVPTQATSSSSMPSSAASSTSTDPSASKASTTVFAACPDIGWPDCFNSGVMLLTPNMGDFYALSALAQRGISFDGADQGLLNMHFRSWDRLSFTYNCTPSAHYQYVPAYRHFQSSISMVHFLGPEKPWKIGRQARGNGTGVYEELRGRWWSVFDRHFHYVSFDTPDSDETVVETVRQWVTGEQVRARLPTPEPRQPTPVALPASDGNTVMTAENSKATSQSSSSQRGEPFSAPLQEWDPARQPPPAQSRPEAPRLPSHQYSMSHDRELFHAPATYPEPPKDMYYSVPGAPPSQQHIKPVFPWEGHQPHPTRVFAQDHVPSPDSSKAGSRRVSTASSTSTPQPTSTKSSTESNEPLSGFDRTNAWDSMPEIDHYVHALQSQRRRGLVHVLHSGSSSVSTAVSDARTSLGPSTATAESLAGSSAGKNKSESSDDGALHQPEPRRPSLRVTDFPTADERPSLPVTPAPVRRTDYWGSAGSDNESGNEDGKDNGDGDGAGSGNTAAHSRKRKPNQSRHQRRSGLARAEGVPSQNEWDPHSRLDELQRRQSQVLAARIAALEIDDATGTARDSGTTTSGIMPMKDRSEVVDESAIDETVVGSNTGMLSSTGNEDTDLVSATVHPARPGNQDALESDEPVSEHLRHAALPDPARPELASASELAAESMHAHVQPVSGL